MVQLNIVKDIRDGFTIIFKDFPLDILIKKRADLLLRLL